MSAAPKLTVLKSDALPFEERAARVLGVDKLPPLPTPREEEWQATNLRPLTALKPLRGSDWELADVARSLPVVHGPQLVLVNGRVVPQLSLLDGLPNDLTLAWEGLHPPLPLHGPLSFWHAAQSGHVVDIQANTSTPTTLHVIHLLAGDETPTGGTLRLTLAQDNNLTLIEHIVGQPASHGWLNNRLLATVEQGATFQHIMVQNLPLTSCYTRRNDITVASTATYKAFTLNLGGTLARAESHLTTHHSSHIHITGLALTDAAQTHDTTLRLTHADEATQSHIRQRNILRGNTSHAVFQGKFVVAKKAQKTDAYMLCESLLLAEGARVSAKPELEIYADDVKCSHGASTGSLNPDQMFYLTARGVPEATAKRLLVSAFADELLADVPATAQTLVSTYVNAWLDERPTTLPTADEAEPDTDWLQ